MSTAEALSTIVNESIPPESQKDHEVSNYFSSLSLSSQTIHADDPLNSYADVAPAMHVSTTFRYPQDTESLIPIADMKPGSRFTGHIYSRYTTPNTTRFESILSQILRGPALTYSSGLSAIHAALTFINPSKISIGDGYHGTHGVIPIISKLSGLQQIPLDCPAEDLSPGDIIHVETPINPTGIAYNIKEYADKAHSRGAYLLVDSTFGPPPLQDPFSLGADLVMHSGTKYFGGHSDMLCGVIAINPKHCTSESTRVIQLRNKPTEDGGKKAMEMETKKGSWWAEMELERMYLGCVMGNMEGWLGVRSIRTLEIRVERQSYNVGKLVEFLHTSLNSSEANPVSLVMESIQHASVQTENNETSEWLKTQMPNGYGPVFSIIMKKEEHAKRLPGLLHLFHHSTSLGGVESLIEWRTMSDSGVDRRLLRVSIGVEGWEDLRDDLVGAMRTLAE